MVAVSTFVRGGWEFPTFPKEVVGVIPVDIVVFSWLLVVCLCELVLLEGLYLLVIDVVDLVVIWRAMEGLLSYIEIGKLSHE